jgi:two-component system, NtrC family, sensor kinase
MGEPSGTGHHRHTVLVVDDDEQVVKSLSELLSRDGHQVFTATSGEAALQCLQQQVPCMALLDVLMPGLDGLALCQRMKQDPRMADIPIALITGQVEAVDVERGLAAGAIDYIKKPFDSDELRVRVRAQIGLHETLREQRRTEERLSLIWRTAKDAIIIIDNEGTITNWNDASSEMFGYTQDEAIGRNLHHLIGPKRFHEAHLSAFARYVHTGQGDAIGRTVELAALRKSGEEFPVDLSLSAANVEGNWCAVGIVRDVSNRKRVERALEESEQEYRMLFQASRDALMTLAPPSWTFLSCNEATLKLFAVESEAEFAKLGPWNVSPQQQPDGRPSAVGAQAMIANAMSEGVASFPWVHKRLNGEEFPCEVLLTRMEHRGEPFLQATVRDTTDRERAAEALRASEARYRASFEDASVGQALVALDGSFVEVNGALASMLGYEIAELCGKDFAELTHQDDRAESANAMRSLVGGGNVIRLEKRYLRKDGSVLWVDVNVAALRNSVGELAQFLTHVIDISERKYAEEATKQGTEFLRKLLNAIPIPIFYKGTDGRYVGINKAFEEFFGIAFDDIVGKTLFDVFPQEMANFYQGKDQELLSQPGSQTYGTQARNHQGVERDVVFHKATFADRNGQLAGITGAMLDITDRKRAEAELGHARKLEAVGQLAAGIAHEINTPAQYVGDGIYFMKEAFESCLPLWRKYGNAMVALEQSGTNAELVTEIRELEKEIDLDYILANVPGSFERCIDGISRISTIVRAMKEFSHPGQREKSPADINQALQNTLIIAKNEYKYVAEVETELGDLPQVMCLLGDLNQVFLNLIVNAAHAVGDVIDKEKEKGQIRISTVREDDWVRIDISDTGGGIPEAIRDRIFEPFFTTKQIGKGSGQGLAIARSIVVDKHGGTLTFTSGMGEGTTFTIRLPIDGNCSVRAGESR